MKLAIVIFLLVTLTACHTGNSIKLVFPDEERPYSDWTKDEKIKTIAVKHLYHGTDSSAHLIRLKGNEAPHYHDYHDLNVSLLSGRSIIHFQDHEVIMRPGDVVFIPKGTYHWAENTDPSASIVFAVFSPAFDGKDKRLAD